MLNSNDPCKHSTLVYPNLINPNFGLSAQWPSNKSHQLLSSSPFNVSSPNHGARIANFLGPVHSGNILKLSKTIVPLSFVFFRMVISLNLHYLYTFKLFVLFHFSGPGSYFISRKNEGLLHSASRHSAK